MRTQATADLREKIINLVKTEAQGMSLDEVSQAIKEAYEDLEETAVPEIISLSESEET